MKYIKDNKLGIFSTLVGFVTFVVASNREDVLGVILGGGCIYLGIDRICKR